MFYECFLDFIVMLPDQDKKSWTQNTSIGFPCDENSLLGKII